ncbi:MAG: MoxR family ATPase [Bacteroidota bacterium]
MSDQLTQATSPQAIKDGFDQLGYVADQELATILFLSLNLRKPLLLEGNPGVGKTEVANILSNWLQLPLIRLQCYEGLDVSTAVYEWNYQKQLISIKIQEHSDKSEEEKTRFIFSEEFLLERPLLQAIRAKDVPPVLLIDEIDRADEEFEAFLLELLSAFQISIPELGTVKAVHKPLVILTSNRTRELGDALKRRCLYYWIPYPDREKEMQIVQKHMPGLEPQLIEQLVSFVQEVRQQEVDKVPGVAETLDWAQGLLALGFKNLSPESIETTLGCLLKSSDDIASFKGEVLSTLLEKIR